jgi:DNA polymerase-1
MLDNQKDDLYLVDGSGYIFRAYYAVPQNLTNLDGVPVGAVLGFVNMILKLLTDLKAPNIAVVFDAARENFRYNIYPEYKANRSETPPDLIPQFPLIREATKAFGIPSIELEGYEADDLIATYARLGREQGRKVIIVGTDKDLMQLVNDHVSLYDPIKGGILGREAVIEKFGVPPEKVIDVQALSGDSVDNVPGVPGIGIKTAAQLITEYGDLESLLSRAGEIKQPKRREALIENADKARLSKRLVTLADDVPIPVPMDDLKAHDPNTPELAAFLQKQGFKSVLVRLGKGADTASALPPPNLPPQGGERIKEGGNDYPSTSNNQYTLIQDEDTLKRWIAEAFEAGVLAIDTETTGLTPAKADLVGISIASKIGQAAYIPVGHTNGQSDLFGTPAPSATDNKEFKQLSLKTVLPPLKPLLEDSSVLKIGHNIKYDMQMFIAHGIHITPCDDTMLMSYVLDGAVHGHGMDELAELHCAHTTIKYDDLTGTGKNRIGFDRVPLDKACDYAAEDAEITLRLHAILKPRLARQKMVAVYEDIERPLIPVIAAMEFAGIKVDQKVLQSLSHEFGVKLAALEADIHKLAGHPFNVGSPKQLGTVLFDEMGLQGGKKTKTGEWSTAADALDELAALGVPIVDKVLEWRQLSKLKSTYSDSLPHDISPRDGRIHTSFHLTGTNTGRFASSDPNLQNIPIRSEEGRRIRAAFIAEDGHVLLSADYSQVELRLAAAMAGVEALKQAFKDGVDIHALTASQVFGVPLDQMTSDLRRQAKAVNFGIIYGISGWGLAKQLGCEPAAANDFIRRYMARFPEIQTFMETKKEEARKYGFVRTLYGRKCVIRDIANKNGALRAFAERQAINAPLQGTAADIMKMAMTKIPRLLRAENLSAKMLLQVHDELVFEVPESETERTALLVKSAMESVADIGVPLTVETGFAKNWAGAH